MDFKSKIFITGSAGMLGQHLKEQLQNLGYNNLFCPIREELDLLDFKSVESYIKKNQPEFVFHLAGLVYGLGGNLHYQLDALYYNSLINLNLLRALSNSAVSKIFFAGTVASYPFPYKSLPLTEDQMFKGLPHQGEYGYAIAKNLGYNFLELISSQTKIDYCIGLFTNLFGEYDNFDVKYGHVIPSLINKIYHAKVDNQPFEVWGNGEATRDFMYAKDASQAAIFLMNNYSGLINISSGNEISMKEVVKNLSEVSNFKGEVEWQINAPVGIHRRSVDNSKLINLRFKNFTDFKQALKNSYSWFENFQK